MEGRREDERERERRETELLHLCQTDLKRKGEGLSRAYPVTVLKFTSQIILSTPLGAVRPRVLILSDAFTWEH